MNTDRILTEASINHPCLMMVWLAAQTAYHNDRITRHTFSQIRINLGNRGLWKIS